MAGVLLGGEGAVLSHRSAGELWGLCRSVLPLVEITVPRGRGCDPRRHLLVHRSRRLGEADQTRRDGILVTSPDRTCLDLAEVLDRRPLERVLDSAHRLGLCHAPELRRATAANPGRVGAAVLATVLAEHGLGSTATANDFEERFLKLCDDSGIPRPECNARIGPYRADFLWRSHRVIVETDGRATHGTPRAFEDDRARDVELGSQGWRVMRFTWRQLVHRPAWVARKALEARCTPAPSPRRSPRPR
jgi:hypothetical protein